MHFNINISRNRVAITCNCLGNFVFFTIFVLFRGYNIYIDYSSGNNAFSSLLPSKSPLHHSSVNAASKNSLSGTSQLGGSNKSSLSNPGTNLSSSSPLPKDLMSFHDQLKKRPPPSKPSDNFSSNTTNSLMNPNQIRNLQSAIPASQQPMQPMRQRPTSGNSPQQVLLSSDDEIMDDSLVGK